MTLGTGLVVGLRGVSPTGLPAGAAASLHASRDLIGCGGGTVLVPGRGANGLGLAGDQVDPGAEQVRDGPPKGEMDHAGGEDLSSLEARPKDGRVHLPEGLAPVSDTSRQPNPKRKLRLRIRAVDDDEGRDAPRRPVLARKFDEAASVHPIGAGGPLSTVTDDRVNGEGCDCVIVAFEGRPLGVKPGVHDVPEGHDIPIQGDVGALRGGTHAGELGGGEEHLSLAGAQVGEEECKLLGREGGHGGQELSVEIAHGVFPFHGNRASKIGGLWLKGPFRPTGKLKKRKERKVIYFPSL